MPDFPDRIKREIGDKFGERPSALDFIPGSQHTAIRDGSSSADLTGWIQDGLDSLGTAGGGVLYLPWGTYPVLDLSIPSNVALVGDGGAKTVLKRRGTLPAGRGVLNLSGSKSGFSDLAIDGHVTTPATALYSSLSDPSASTLIANSSVRIHPGAKDISLSRFRIFHTGGYAVHIDCRTGNVYRITIDEPDLHDNRSFLFGATSGSEIYGSWTGGILAQGDGLTSSYGVRGLTVRDGRFRRGTGNQVWSHLYGFGTLHTDFKIQGCTFEDIGRDGVMLGGVVGGDVAGNFFRRIGYICSDDVSAGIPRWINGQWAVGLDTAGLTRGVSYRGNSFVSCYGAAMDLDGFAEGVVSDNTVIVPTAGEPEYTEDSVSSWAGNYCYGVQTSNSNNIADAAVGVRVTGNRFRNCGLGAIRMYASRRGNVSGNTIDHPAAASTAPIILGNIGSGAYQRAYGNTVTDNDIHYSPGNVVSAIQEDTNGYAFAGSDVNRVYGNRLHGTNTFEFLRASTSGSRTGQEFASNKTGLTVESKNTLQREDGYLRAYWTSGATTKSVLSVLDQTALSGGLFGGSLLNVSTDAVGGVIATGARTSSAFDDAILSSKLYADGFLAIAATTFNATEANLLADTVGLIRFNATTKIFEQSNSVSAGARVWAAFGGGSSLSGLTAGRVPFTTGSSAIADSANLTWNNAGRVLTVTGATGTAGIVAATSFIQSQEGFLTTSASSTAINALSGGVSALSLIAIRNDGAAGLNLIRNSGANQRSFGIGVNGSGQLFVSDDTAAATRITMNSAGLVTFGSTVAIDQAGNLSASAVVSAAGVNVSGTAYNALQVPSGGLFAGLGATLDQALYLKTFAGNPNSPGAGYGAWSHRSGSIYLYWNGSAWATVDLAGGLTSVNSMTGPAIAISAGTGISVANGSNTVTITNTGVTSLAGTANQVSVSASTGGITLSLPQSIHTGATPTFSALTISSAASNAISVTGSVSAAGFAASGTAPNQIQCTAGGVSAKYLIATTSLTLAAETSANAGLSAAGQGRIYFDSSTSKFQVSQNGGAYVDLLFSGLTSVNSMTGPAISIAASTGISVANGSNTVTITNTGVTSLAGTANQVSVSASTGAITLSLPQSIHTGATPTFSALTISSAASNAISVTGSVSAAGFAASGTAPNQIQCTAGGVSAKYLIATTSLTLAAETSANAGLSAAGQGRIYFDSSISKFQVSQNGGAYVDLLSSGGLTSVNSMTGPAIAISAGTGISVANGSNTVTITNTGVTSLAGTANQVLASAPTGAVTLSLPQNIHTGASPTFASLVVGGSGTYVPGAIYSDANWGMIFRAKQASPVTAEFLWASSVNGALMSLSSAAVLSVAGVASTVFNSTATGATYAFQTSNSNFIVNGNGVVSSAGGYNAGGVNVIDASQNISATRLRVNLASLPAATGGNDPTMAVYGSTRTHLIHGQNKLLMLPAANNGAATGDAGLYTWISEPYATWTGAGIARNMTNTSGSFPRVNSGLSGQMIRFDEGTGIIFTSETSGGTRYTPLTLTAADATFTGSVTATTGFNTASTAYNSIQTANGFLGKQLMFTSKANPGASTAGNAILYMDSGSNELRASVNAGGYVSLAQQNLGTGASPTFYALTTSDAIQSNRSTGPAIYAPNAYMQGRGYVSSGLSAYNSIQSDAGISAGSGANGGFYVGSTQVINTSGQFVGAGMNVGANGINAGGYNVNGGYSGQTWNVLGTFTINGFNYTTLIFRGGVLVSAS